MAANAGLSTFGSESRAGQKGSGVAGDNATASARERTHLRAALVLSPFFVAMLAFVWLLMATAFRFGGPGGVGFGSDFAMMYTAARVQVQGGNPYDHVRLFREERQILPSQGVRAMAVRSLVRVGNPPFLWWALRPLAGLPFRLAGWIWTGLMLLLSAFGFLLCLRVLGWKRQLLPLAVFLAMPQVAFGWYYGNVTAVIFAALAGALFLLDRSQAPWAAGALLSLAWLKPSLALPLVLLVLLFHTRRWRAAAAGFAAASAALLGLTVIACGTQSLAGWADALRDYSRDIASQPEIATLSGLYAHWAPATLRVLFGAVTLIAVGAATAVCWWRLGPDRPVAFLSVAWLWMAWFLATPYAHVEDVMLLTVPILVLVGQDARRSSRALPALALYLLFTGFVFDRVPGIPVELEPLKLLLIGGILALASLRPQLSAATASPHDPQGGLLSARGQVI